MIFELVIDVIVIVAASAVVDVVLVEPLFVFLGWIVISGDEKHHISTRSVLPTNEEREREQSKKQRSLAKQTHETKLDLFEPRHSASFDLFAPNFQFCRKPWK